MSNEPTIQPGDRVEWNFSGNTVRGKVKRKLTEPIEIKGRHVAASEENPEHLVVSDDTGAEAAHKPSALTRV